MKRRSLWSAILPLSILAACGPGELVVTAEVERMNPETGEMELRPVENLAVQLLPFDRDHIFDSLTAAADTPEPQMPPELAQARDSIIAAQTEWREAEAQWLEQRERLQQISDEQRLEELIGQVLDENPDAVVDYAAGKERVVGFLMGQIMQKTQGQANPQLANEKLREALAEEKEAGGGED